MIKYLFRFNKKGNMRFISHLDLGRLFSRAIKIADIDVSYSSGFNPHERINIVQPLSLGIESDSEYFEIFTNTDYQADELRLLLNKSMPFGIEFFIGKIIPEEKGNYSNHCEAASYTANIYLSSDEISKIDVESFKHKEHIIVSKRDKKTKKYVPKDVTSFVYDMESVDCVNCLCINMILRCAPNETLNPFNLIYSLLDEYQVKYTQGDIRLTRNDILSRKDGKFISLYES